MDETVREMLEAMRQEAVERAEGRDDYYVLPQSGMPIGPLSHENADQVLGKLLQYGHAKLLRVVEDYQK